MSEYASDLTALVRAPTHGGERERAAVKVPPPRAKWRTRLLLPAVILLATGALLLYAAGDALWPATPVRVVPVLSKSGGEDVQMAGSVVVQAPGWVEADPFPTAVSALANGVVEEVLVLEGERVEPGQVVARLVDEDARIALSQAQAVLAEREAALQVARAGLDEAQRNWEHPIELTRKCQTAEAQLAEKQAELQRWPAELAREQAHAVYLQAEFERIAPLHQRGQASDIELVQAQQAHLAQQAAVDAMQHRKPILEAQLASLAAELRAARENLELRIVDTRALAEAEASVQRAMAAVASAAAERDDAALRLERMEVRAPVGGVVMTRLVEPGSKLMLQGDMPHSAQVARVYDPARLQVRVDVPLVDAAKVGLGQPAEVIVDVLPDRVFRGHVSRVVHEADVQKNTLQVKVAIDSPAPEIKPEMLARARFLAHPDRAATDGPGGGGAQRLYVPQDVVRTRDGRSYVWLADQVAGVARRQEITPGTAVLDGWIAVVSGLQPGDRVIVDAPDNLHDGQRIHLVEESER